MAKRNLNSPIISYSFFVSGIPSSISVVCDNKMRRTDVRIELNHICQVESNYLFRLVYVAYKISNIRERESLFCRLIQNQAGGEDL